MTLHHLRTLPRAGDIGEGQREWQYEPLEVPQTAPAPAQPLPQTSPDREPAAPVVEPAREPVPA